MRRIRTNTSNVIPMKVGTTRLTRVRMKRSMMTLLFKTSRRATGGAAVTAPPQLPLLVDVDAVEVVTPERRELEVDHALAHRFQLHRMRDREPGRLSLEDDLRLLVELGALGLIGSRLCLDDEIVERLVAPLRDVGAGNRVCGIATEQGVQEVIRIAVVAGPAEHAHLMLAFLQALAVLTPLERLDLGLDADLGEVGLHQFGDALG